MTEPAPAPASAPTPIASPIAQGASIATFNLHAPAGATLAPFALGHAFRKGAVTQSSGIVASIPEFQAVVKNRWPDGSAKFAILSGRATVSGGTPLPVTVAVGTPGPVTDLTEADLQATGVRASIAFSGVGTVELSALIGVASAYNASARRWTPGRVEQWIGGPQMSSWIYYAPLGSDPHLAAWFEVRLWRGGHVEVLPWIENGYLNVAGPTAKSGTATFVLGSSQRFSQAVTLQHHQRAVLAGGATLSHWLGNDPQISVQHDTSYFESTRTVPAYYGETAAGSPLWSRLPTGYTPLGQASFPNAMGSAGYDPSIGMLPEWDVAYLTGNGDARAARAIIINAYSSGRYGIHYRDETTNRPLRFSSYPNLVLNDANAGVSSSGASTREQYTPAPGSGSAPNWASSHHPSVGYMAYLLTGRRYFMEEIQFAATLNHLKQTDETRGFTKGLLRPDAGANTTRGAAWALRTLAQAASATPDGDTVLRTEFNTALEENINYNHDLYVARPNNPQGICRPYSDYTSGDGKFFHSIWMEDFLTAAWGHVLELDLGISSAGRTKLGAFFAWKARSIVGRFGDASGSSYCYRSAAQYTIAVAPSDDPDWLTGTGPWYSDWGQIYLATTGQTNDCGTGSDLRGAYFPEPTSYWGNLQPAIAYAAEHGAAGADAAYRRMTGASNWSQILGAWNDDPVWGVRPRSLAAANGSSGATSASTSSGSTSTTTSTPTAEPTNTTTTTTTATVAAPVASSGTTTIEVPAWRTGQAVLEWREIPRSSLSFAPPTVNPGGITGPRSKVDAWCGFALDSRTSTLYGLANGGHADYYGNEVNSINLADAAPAWVERRASTPASQLILNTTHYADGRPCSSHTYYTPVFIESLNRAMRFGVGSVAGSGFPALAVDGFNTQSNDWDRAGSYPNFPSAFETGWAVAKDPATENVYAFAGFSAHRWNRASNTWSSVGTAPASGYYAASAVDTSRNRLLFLGGQASAPTLLNLSNQTFTQVSLSGSGAGALQGSQMGMVYDSNLDAFLVCTGAGGGAVYRINAATFAVDVLAASGGSAIGAAINGVYRRFLYVPKLGGIVYYPHYGSNLWFLRTV